MKAFAICVTAFVIPVVVVLAMNVDSISEIDKSSGKLYYFSAAG